MVKIFKLRLATQKDFDALMERIDGVVASNADARQKQDKKLSTFEGKFDASMDFIGRNLPLKRKRKAFRKIVEA
jgi:hypothetical protein